MSESAPRVVIVVLTWNEWALTVDCVQSLLGLDYPGAWIVVVDNGSSDGTPDRIRQAFGQQVALIALKENRGFTGGNNVGIRYALEQDADYVLLLNNDTVAGDPALVRKLVTAAESDASIGLASPTIYYFDPPDKVWYAGAALSLWTGWKHHRDVPADGRPRDTGYASGCCILARARLVRDVGLLAESYFLSVEDLEWSLRARRAGWRVVHVPDASLLHKASISSRDRTGAGIFSPTRVYYEHRNSVWLIRQYGNRAQRWLVWPIRFACLWIYKAAGYVVLRRWAKLRALLRAMRDGVLIAPGSRAGTALEKEWRRL